MSTGSPTSVGQIRLEQPALSPVSAAEIIEWIRAQMALGDLTNLRFHAIPARGLAQTLFRSDAAAIYSPDAGVPKRPYRPTLSMGNEALPILGFAVRLRLG